MTVCRFKSGVWQKRGGWYPNARYIYIFIIYIYNIYICIYIYMYIGFWKMKNQINWLPLAIQGERRIALGKLFPNRLSKKKKKNCLNKSLSGRWLPRELPPDELSHNKLSRWRFAPKELPWHNSPPIPV